MNPERDTCENNRMSTLINRPHIKKPTSVYQQYHVRTVRRRSTRSESAPNDWWLKKRRRKRGVRIPTDTLTGGVERSADPVDDGALGCRPHRGCLRFLAAAKEKKYSRIAIGHYVDHDRPDKKVRERWRRVLSGN